MRSRRCLRMRHRLKDTISFTCHGGSAVERREGRIACGLAIIDTVPDEHLTGVRQPRVVNLYMDNAVTVLAPEAGRWNVQRLPHRMGRP